MTIRLRSCLAGPVALLGALALFAAAPLAHAQSIRLSQLVNLSVRSKLTAGQTLVAGFVVSGDASTTARVLVRGVGPTLTSFGVTDAMPNPKIVLAATSPGSSVTVANDDWSTSGRQLVNSGGVAEQSITQWDNAFALPNNSKDAAILAELKPGTYTVTLSGVAATDAGTALIEVYNVAPRTSNSAARLSNLSVLGSVTPTTPLVAGFVLDGSNSEEIYFRAVGPGLSSFGVANAITDCRFDVMNAQGVTAFGNDNWELGEPEGFLTRFLVLRGNSYTGAFPLVEGSKDAATTKPLLPNDKFPERPNMVRGSSVGGASGMMLLEIYEMRTEELLKL